MRRELDRKMMDVRLLKQQLEALEAIDTASNSATGDGDEQDFDASMPLAKRALCERFCGPAVPKLADICLIFGLSRSNTDLHCWLHSLT